MSLLHTYINKQIEINIWLELRPTATFEAILSDVAAHLPKICFRCRTGLDFYFLLLMAALHDTRYQSGEAQE